MKQWPQQSLRTLKRATSKAKDSCVQRRVQYRQAFDKQLVILLLLWLLFCSHGVFTSVCLLHDSAYTGSEMLAFLGNFWCPIWLALMSLLASYFQYLLLFELSAAERDQRTGRSWSARRWGSFVFTQSILIKRTQLQNVDKIFWASGARAFLRSCMRSRTCGTCAENHSGSCDPCWCRGWWSSMYTGPGRLKSKEIHFEFCRDRPYSQDAHSQGACIMFHYGEQVPQEPK